MNLRSLVLCLFLSLGLSGFAQDEWEKLCAEQPKTALQKANELYTQAVRTNNYPEVVQALILQTCCKVQINADSFPVMLKRVEDVLQQSKDTAETSMLHTLLAELYQEYYQRNSYRINQRKALAGYVPEDIAEWSGNLFMEKIFFHALEALKGAPVLQKMNVTTYRATLLAGEDSELLRPTLYDFIGYRSIYQLEQCRRLNIERYFPQQTLTDSVLLSSAAVFLKYPLHVKSMDIQSHVLKIYQDLLAFSYEENNIPARLMADLARIEYVKEMVNLPARYLQVLEQLSDEYEATPYVVEVWSREADWYCDNGEKENQSANRLKAVEICKEGISRYPDYKRINILKGLIRRLEEQNLRLDYDVQVYPGQDLVLNVNYQNISGMKVNVFRLNESTLNYYNKEAAIRKEKVSSGEYILSSKLVSQDTVLRIPVSKSGLYEVVIHAGKQEYREMFVCTRLLGDVRVYPDNRFHFMVRDAMSGKPVENARITMYVNDKVSDRKPHYAPDSLKSVRTDKYGMAVCPVPAKKGGYNRAVYYEITDVENPNGDMLRYNYYRDRFYGEEKESTVGAIYTDRKLYRPGETVFYSCILWKSYPDSCSVLAGKKYTVRLYNISASKMLSEHAKVSNEWGTLSGSFVIPKESMNGSYEISSEAGASATIEVAEYKRPKLEILFNPQDQGYAFGDSIQATGSVKTYSGVLLSDCKVKYEVILNNLYGWPGNSATPIASGETITDNGGRFSVDIVTVAPKENRFQGRGNYYYSVKVVASDERGESQEATTIIPISNKAFSMSLSIPEYVNKEKSEVLRVRAVNSEHREIMEQVHYIIYSLKPLKELGDSYRPEEAPLDKIMAEGTLYTNRDSLQLDFGQWASGAYLLKLEAAGNKQIESKQLFYLYSVRDKHLPVLQYSWMDKNELYCKVGENAEVLFGTSAKDAYVLSEIFSRKGLEKQEYLKISDEMIRLSIPYEKRYGDNITVSLSFVKDGRIHRETVRIYRVYEERALKITTQVFRDRLQPGEKEQWVFKIENYKGEAVGAEMMAVMYDQSLDKLRPHNWAIHPFRYSQYWTADWGRYKLGDTKNMYFNFPTLFLDIPEFSFDRLNLYGLGRYGYEIMDAGMEEMSVSADNTIQGRSQVVMKSRAMEGVAAAPKMLSAGLARGDASNAYPETEGVSLRQNFNATAFFYPQLVSDKDGVVTIRFTVPDATTRWKFMALAHTKEMYNGFVEKEIVTAKDFMVTPNLPRFLRTGDDNVLKATIHNLSKSAQSGKACLELFRPVDGEVIWRQEVDFSVPQGENTTVSFRFKVPGEVSVVGCRITASSKEFSDGEQHLLAVLPDEVLLTESMPMFMNHSGSETFQMKVASKTKRDYALTVEMTANPMWYAVMALPQLQEVSTENITSIAAAFYVNAVASHIANANPRIKNVIDRWKESTKDSPVSHSKLEQNEELKSILLEASPWVLEAQNETERMQSLSELFNVNRIRDLESRALVKMRDMQNEDGGWSWFKGMNSSQFMTCNVLAILSKAVSTAQKEYGEKDKMMQIKALRYLDNEIRLEYEKPDRSKNISYNQLVYLYVRSMYGDIPLGDVLTAHKYYMGLVQKSWSTFSFYEKAIAASTLWRYGMQDTAAEILKSLKEFTTISPDMGMYWANNRSEAFYQNSAILTHVAIMEAFHEVQGNNADTDLMKQWLLRQKQTQNWGNAPSTVEAVYALLLTGSDQLDVKEELTVAVGSQEVKNASADEALGYMKVVYPAAQLSSDMSKVTVTKQTDVASWGALYLQYFDKLNDVRKNKNAILNVEKKLFIEKSKGGRNELVPVAGALQVGDKVVVRITIHIDRDMQYLHLKDLRAACLEPVKQISGNQWKYGTFYFEEVKDASTHFFIDFLPKGTYVFEYPAWVNQSGSYQDGLATIQCMYAPEYVSHSLTSEIVVK